MKSSAEPITAASREVAEVSETRERGTRLTAPGNHVRKLMFDGLERSCVIHIPPGLDPAKPAPLMLVLHGAAMNADMMAGFSGMNKEADRSRFIAVYPNGTGLEGTLLVWNSGGLGPVRAKPDDVGFIRALLEDLPSVLNIDPRRIYAAGLSNGGMMAYRLATELSGRIAAIAAVGGTLALPNPRPTRPVPAIHFHGTADRIVAYDGPGKRGAPGMSFRSVPDTIATWAALTGCPPEPVVTEIPDQFEDGTTVTLSRFGPGKEGAEVLLVAITGGGHTWPGQQPAVSLLGKSTREISANRMIWEFFQKHPLP